MAMVSAIDSSMPKSRAATAPSIGVARPSDVPVPPISARMNSTSTALPQGRLAKSLPKRPVKAPDKRKCGSR